MFDYDFVGPDLSVEIFFGKHEEAENRDVNFQIRDIDTSAHLYWG